MCHKIRLPSVQCALLAALLFGANQTLCQLLGAPGGCATIAMLNAQQPGASPQAPSFQQPFAPSFGCPLSALGAFGRQFPPPPPGGAGGQFPMPGQSAGNFPVNVMNPNFMGTSSQPQQNGGGGAVAAGGNNNFGTNGNNCNCGPCCSDGGGAANSFGMPSTGGGEFGGAIVGAGLNNINNNVNGIAGGGTIDMVNGGMGVFGRRRRR
uniref:Uncharacterized protein n=1 Tax=Globodera rostochiensis TaxID=31243 RepID=A0A914GXV7_GLORO